MEFEVTKLGERGQVVIPQEFRENMGLRKGDKFFVMERKDTLILKRMHPPSVQDFETMIRLAHRHAKKHHLTQKDGLAALRKARSTK